MSHPSGLVTFLFTSIEGKVRLAQEFPDTFSSSLEKHNAIIRRSAESNRGFIFKTVEDAHCIAFENEIDALNAAVDIQKEISAVDWKVPVIKVRMGIHSGSAEWKGDDYSGYVTLAGCSRIMSAAYGGQILISDDSYKLIFGNERNAGKYLNSEGTEKTFRDSFRDLGERRLKDLKEPVRLFQIVSEGLISDFPPIKTLDIRPNNLPYELTSFVGREKEMDEIRTILKTSRLLTLLGPGGTGKSRLAFHVAADIIDEFENGVWVVELASVSDPSLIYNAIANSLKIKETGGGTLPELTELFLKKKEILLIFDNCEHLINDCAEIIDSLLAQCKGLKIIATSRESLKITGERIYKVPTLTMPDIKDKLTKEKISNFEAVRLFAERAKAVKIEFEINDSNAEAIGRLCHHIDGIPLAIELAAARIKVMNVEKILENISNMFRLLTGGSRTALPRQKTLKTLIDWSYNLLSEKEKILFRNLSVFSGGWTINSAEEVCRTDEIDGSEVLDILSNLLDKSLVVSKEKNGILRFNMLETIRQYSLEKFVSKDEVSEKHFEYFLKLADLYSWLDEPETSKKLTIQMESEHDNFRSAIKWSLEKIPDRASGLVLKVAEYWEAVGNYSEALEAMKRILDTEFHIDGQLRANALLSAGFLSSNLGENDEAENYLSQALEFSKSTGDDLHTAEALSVLGIVSYVKGDWEAARKYYEESLKLLEGKNESFRESLVKNNLATYYSGTGNPEAALKLLDECLEIQKNLNKRDQLSKLLMSKGGVHYQKGDLESAEECFDEGLKLSEEFNDHYSMVTALYNLGNLSFTLKNYSKAIDYYERAMALSLEFGHTGTYDRSHIKLGEIYLIQNQREKAKNIFSECLRSSNKDSEKLKLNLSIYGLAKYYFSGKNFESSARLFFLTERISEAIQFKFSKSRLEENNELMSEIKRELGEERFSEIHDEAAQLDLGNAAEIALGMDDGG